MKIVYVLIGAPGSGKSDWARQNAARLNATVVSSDDVRIDFQAAGRNPRDNDAVFAEVERRARDVLSAGQSVLLDATHVERRYRAYALGLARDVGVRRVAVWFDVPLAECLRRNAGRQGRTFGNERVPERVVRDLFARCQPPGPAEFDEIIRVG